MTKPIKIALIPVAGKGTRFLPVSKGVFKTMFPIINKPTLQYLIEEVKDAGINEIIIVISDYQKAIKDYFDKNSDYYKDLNINNDYLLSLEKIIEEVKLTFVIQENPKGLGDAILCCENYIKDQDFALLLGDDLVMKEDGCYGIGDLINCYNENPAYYIGVKEVPLKDTHKYGIVKIDENMKITQMVEKPKENPPSNFAAVGRYILKNNVFDYLKQKPYDGIHEVQLTDAFILALAKENVFARAFKGERFDVGDHAGYVKANIAFSLMREDLKDEITAFIKERKI